MRHSFIIPVYNVSPYLRQCLDSILNQDFQDYEVLLIDDGSTDGSALICDEYASKNPKVSVTHVSNGGASRARNIGLDKARGEWISFVDADDWIEPDYLSTFWNREEKCDITFFWVNQILSSEETIVRCPKPQVVKSRQSIEATIAKLKYGRLDDIFGWTWGKFYKASIIKEHQIKFVEGLVFREDEIFTMDYCRWVMSLEILGKPLYNYRYVCNGLTAGGIKNGDYQILSDHLYENLCYYSNEDLLSNDKYRMMDYYVMTVWIKFSWTNLKGAIRPLWLFCHQKPEFIEYIRNKQMASVLKHTFPQACLFFFINRVLRMLEVKLERLRTAL